LRFSTTQLVHMYATQKRKDLGQAAEPAPGLEGAGERKLQFLGYFGFSESPFGVTPNPAFLFSSTMHGAALQSMIDSIESNLGFTVLLGNPGMGKTTLLLQLLSQYRDTARTAFIFQTQCKRHELLRYLAADLGLDVANGDEVSLHHRFQQMLVNEARAGRKVLIFIDEAQNLHHSSLEAVRLLSDFETPRAKLLHIVLAGSARLGETLLGTELSQLAQRVSTICRLQPLTPEDVSRYVRFRLRVAGCGAPENLFSPEALREVARHSAGVPRVVNSICYRSLYLAYVTGERHVSGMLVQQAVKDLDLAHAGANQNVVSHFSAQEPPAPLPDLVIAEEKRKLPELEGARQQISNRNMRAPADEPMQFRTLVSGAARSVEQPPAPQRESMNVRAPHQDGKDLAAARHSSPGSPRRGRVTPDPGFKLGALEIQKARNDRFTGALAVLLLLLTTLGSWTVWGKLYSKAGAAAHPAGKIIAVSSEKEDWGALFRVPQLDALMATGKVGSTPTYQKLRPKAPLVAGSDGSVIVETRPQTVVGSRIPPSANPAQEAAPSNMAMSAASSQLSLKSVPLPVPRLEATIPPAATETNTPSNTATNADAGTDVQQTSFPQPIKIVQPEYPKLAKLRQVEGDVLLELQIDPKGQVRNVRTISGNILLREAAENAARQWQYAPSAVDKLPTPAVTRVRINFKLNPEAKR
jgi:TonB family protein